MMAEVEKRDEVVYHSFTSGAQTHRSKQTQHGNITRTQLRGKVIRITPAFVLCLGAECGRTSGLQV